MFLEMIKALLLIFVAEMGDKTQILAMAFATQFKMNRVLLGIGIGSLLNHGFAIVLGSMLIKYIPVETIQIIAGLAFVAFSLWTLKSDDFEESDDASLKFGPTVTVAIAFFLGELGDKTQLTAVTLAIDASYPMMILAGTVLGMIITGAIGILIGKKLGDRIPEFAIKIMASSIFMGFGLQKLYETLPKSVLKTIYVLPFLILIGSIMAIMLYILFAKRREGILSDYSIKSKILHDYYEHIQKDLECLCDVCDGKCNRVSEGIEGDIAIKVEEQLNRLTEIRIRSMKKDRYNIFSVEQVLDSLIDTIWVIDHVKDNDRLSYAQQIRRELERTIIKTVCLEYNDIGSYVKFIEKENKDLAKTIHKLYRLRMSLEERVINLGSQANNMYLIDTANGYIMIDTGLKNHYRKFCHALSNHHIALEEISYVFITHAHKNHVGFLKEILDATQAKVILHPLTVKQLSKGENSYEGGFSSFFAYFIYGIKRYISRGSHKFDVIKDSNRYIIVSENDQGDLYELSDIRVIDLPGHTKDSMGLIIEEEILFCGDAVVNRLGGKERIVHWIESIIDYKRSWDKMSQNNFTSIYPTHGKPFSKEELIKGKKKLNNVKIRVS